MKTTLITGASGGIGEEFARQLAARGNNLLLVARSEDRLAKLANELSDQHKITAQHVALDLTAERAAHNLFAETERRELEVDFLINNAGFGSLGDFASFDVERDEQMIALNISVLVSLTHFYIRPMRERRRGAIINVASTAAFQPVPYMATYAATKAFVLSFSEALAEENRQHGVKVMALCPGATDTNFFAAAEATRPPYRMMQTPQAVVETALRALEKGNSHVISGWSNYFVTQAERLIPRSVVTRIAGKAMRHYGKD
ncbi:MAG: SDR family oxidoreductase [Pyrinomonadaceae bacterium]|nr:SDR family oxidoreductase [Pyrinomonadaceae bacterium]